MKFLRILQKRRQHIKDALRKEMHTCKLEAQNIMRFGRHQILPSFWYLLVAAPVLLESSDSADKARQTFLSRLPLLQRRPARSGMRLEFAVLLIGSRKERHVHGIVMVEVYSESIPKPVSGAKGAAAHLSDGFVKRVYGLSFRRQFRPSQQGWISFEFWGSHSSILPPRGVNMACPVVDLSSSVAT